VELILVARVDTFYIAYSTHANCAMPTIIVVNNAGIQHVAPIDQFPIERWNDIIAINLTAPFITTRTAIPHFRRGTFHLLHDNNIHDDVACLL
jgi:NAD(P)-dependent dehydrogenase (short-subunit alcohol dehydrogenase family)